ncbi:MAG: recombination protein RecR [Candidatus Nealsonbacteria bacterium]|nr:recombination protein RecR [Candidatus Nealsonbacteria bacterium]
MYSPAIQKLIDIFSRFPGVGPRTASRFVFYLLRKPSDEFDELFKSVASLRKAVKICSFCLNPFESPDKETLCPICLDPRRDRARLCVVEKEADLALLEKTKKYKGLYFVLGGLLSPLRKRENDHQLVDDFLKRVKNPERFGLTGANFEEIILAISSTTEGEATTLYLERHLKPLNKKMTRLGQGLPLGGEIEYADEETLSSALESRKEI